ncbi:unnamed protein product [Gordionus sp. m RMFG-2023]
MIDFEQAEINAFTHSFPSITIRGCFFHMTQAIWRHIQSDSELLSHYLDRDAGSDWSIKIRQMVSLAFVPVEDVFDAFYGLLHIQFYQDNESVLDKLITYYEATWIGKTLRNGDRQEPRFPIPLWNQYAATLEGIPKTNNAVEGWHRAFSSLLSSHHPSIWKFLDALRLEQSLTEAKIEQYISGTQPPRSRKMYRDTAENIILIVSDYVNRPINDYLRGIAYNFNLQTN